MVTRLLCAVLFVFAVLGAPQTAEAAKSEYVIISGGVALRGWENYRKEADRHDRWWGNFIRPARVRMEELRKGLGPDAQITWLVHRPSYERRAAVQGEPLVDWIVSVQQKLNVNLVWFEDGKEVISYINSGQSRFRTKIASLEYFGHSNKFCLMFEYSNEVLGASKSYLHVQDIPKIKRSAFARDAFVMSYGCHTGEAMSQVFEKYIGIPMIGAVGKTDYSYGYYVKLSPGGSWTRDPYRPIQ